MNNNDLEQNSMQKVIYFYSRRDEYGFCSNFWPSPINVKGVEWPTTEHWYQAQKFPHLPAYQERIRNAKTPSGAAKLGRDKTVPVRLDWETEDLNKPGRKVKDVIMARALLFKFAQHWDLTKKLCESGDAILVEHTDADNYWADGGDGSGKNMLGILLMEVRDTLQKAEFYK